MSPQNPSLDDYRRAVAAAPNDLALRGELTDRLLSAELWEEAEAHLRVLAGMLPAHAGVRVNLAHALRMQHRLEESAGECREALRLQPESAEAWINLGAAQSESGQPLAAIGSYRAGVRARPDLSLAHSHLLYAMHFDPAIEPEAMFAEHRAWASRHAAQLATRPPDPSDTQSRRVRIGYVSGDFRDHPVGYFLQPLLREHDRGRFEIHAFSDVRRPDPITERFMWWVDGWHDVWGLDDAALADLVRGKGIDILVDLSGHCGSVRLLAFARKPAPVQVTWLGYPNTTGLAAMDYRFTDVQADPPGETDRFHSERLIRLPNGFLCCPPMDAVDVAPGPVERGGPITFGCFGHAAKLSAPTIALWSRILREAGSDARLLIKSQSETDEHNRRLLRESFAEHGIDPSRLEILPREALYVDHLAQYAKIDIALDTFPYNGTTTTCEALSMGVPVVTLAGRMHVSRVGVSLLTHAGLADWTAADADDYVRIALNLAGDRARLATLRRDLRPRLLASPLCHAKRFARDVESAYLSMCGV